MLTTRTHLCAERTGKSLRHTLISVGARYIFVVALLLSLLPDYSVAQLTGPARGSGTSDQQDLPSEDSIKREVLRLIATRYYRTVPVDTHRTAREIVDSLDPFTSYLDPEQAEAFKNRLRLAEERFGFTHDTIDGEFIIVSVARGGMAEERQIQLGDQLLRINGIELHGREKLMDTLIPKGLQWAEFTVRSVRDGQLRTVTLGRRVIETRFVPTAMMVDSTVGYVRLTTFGQQSGERGTASAQVRHAIETLQERGMTSLILDLRGNGGGYVCEALALANLFLHTTDTVLSLRGAHVADDTDEIGVDPFYRRYHYRPVFGYALPEEAPFATMPLAILVDEGSASATELFTGILQDLGRAVVIGEPTVGKGLVMRIHELENGAQLYLAETEYVLPSGRRVQRPYQGAHLLGQELRTFQTCTNFDHALDQTIDPGTCDTITTPGGRTLVGATGIIPELIMPDVTAPQAVFTARDLMVPYIVRECGRWLSEAPLDTVLAWAVPERIQEHFLDLVRREDTSAQHDIAMHVAAEAAGLLRATIAYYVSDTYGWDCAYTLHTAIIRRAAELLHHGAGVPNGSIAIITP